MNRPSLHGRDRELAHAVTALHRAESTGSGGVVLLTGEAGIGKSAVLAALGRRALSTGFALGFGKADEVGQISPGAPLLLALRSGPRPLLGRDDLAELTALVDRPLLLVDRIGGHLEQLAATTGLMIAVDDVQWADRLSLFALRTLASRLAALPIVWAFTSRDDAPGLLSDLSVPGEPEVAVQAVDLGPLSDAAMIGIAEERLGRPPSAATSRLLRGIGGNPLLAVQILDGEAVGQAPAEFIVGVRRALNATGPGPAELIRVAAVLGRPFAPDEDAELLTSSPGTAPERLADRIEGAVASGLMTRRDGSLAFRHDLVRETVYADLDPATRRDLHRRCAAHLLRTGHGALAAAPHARAMATPGDDEAITVLSRAAEEAVTAMPHTAGDLILEAFHLTGPGDPRRADVGERCVSILSRVQRGAEAVAVADGLLARGDLDAGRAARIQVDAATTEWLSGRLGDSVARVRRALAADDVPGPLRARLRATEALVLTRTAPVTARRAAAVALADALGTGDRKARQVAVLAAGEVARNAGRHAESLAYFGELRVLAGAPYLAQEIVALQLLDRYDEAQDMLATAWFDAHHHGDEAILASLLEAQLWQDTDLSRFDDAEATARTLLVVSREVGNHAQELNALMILGAIGLRRGDPQEARKRIRPAVEGAMDAEFRAPGLTLMLGSLEAAQGRPAEAVRRLSPLLYSAREATTYWPWWPGWMQTFLKIGRAAGDQAFVAESVAIARVGADRNPGVASFEGIALHLEGVADHDLATLARAVEAVERSPRPLLRAVCLEDHGRLLVEAGRRAEGIAQLDRAWDLYHRIGQPAGMSAVQRALRGAGVRRARWPAAGPRAVSGWESLTVTERRVAGLVGEGHTNRSVAQELGLSPNTVSTHLRSIFAKLGVQSRVQLTNVIHTRAVGSRLT